MRIKVLLFANLREKTGKSLLECDLPEGSSIGDLKRYIIEQYPAVRAQFNKVLVSVNREIALDSDTIPDGAEIAIMPPVSGGSGPITIIKVCQEDLNQESLVRQLVTESCGGVCTFTGVVRGVTERNDPHLTDALVYEAYQEMAEEKMRQVADEIRLRWQGIQGIGILHRVGRLIPGETAVLVACSGSHRDSGIFEAARYGIERIKEIVPVWKKEIRPDGESWIGERE